MRFFAAAVFTGAILLGGAQMALAQDAGSVRRDAPARITVRPLPRVQVAPSPVPMVRECEPAFEERWIPQWGGRVLYAGQSCRWVRAY
jgi:hypothetical protein